MSNVSMNLRIRPVILLFGDSITEFAYGQNNQIGWGSLLSSRYSRRADVLSRGFAGYNTRHALGVLPSIIGSSDSSSEGDDNRFKTPLLFCTIFFGANDASLPSARQHLELTEYCQNMREIITSVKKCASSPPGENGVPVILFTPPPVSPKVWDHYCSVVSPRPLSPRSNENSKEYGRKVIEIGKEMNCPVVDAFHLLGGDQEEDFYKKYLIDGLHLNAEGNLIVYNGLMDVIKKHYGHLLPMEDGDGRYGSKGIALEEKLWTELC